MHEERMEFVRKLRRFHRRETLEQMVLHMEKRLAETELEAFRSAADHRRAELVTGRLYDRIPADVWRYVR